MSVRSGLALLVFVLICFSAAGCASVSYYSQSIAGHSRIMLARKPIAEVAQDAPESLRDQLELAISLRRFAVEQLGLPDNKSYTHYVELDRAYAVWNVVAAAEFSVDPKQWCYLVIGCAGYRGYYREKAARDYAHRLEENGFETLVGGVTAYSTLGWFSDPVLSSMLRYGDIELAETLFHELAHQVLYVENNTEFNEAFATVVGEAGTRKWLKMTRPEQLLDYQDRLVALTQFNQLISGTKARLADLYLKDMPSEKMRLEKARELKQLQLEYHKLKHHSWGDKPWFDAWFRRPLNNARLAAFANYREVVPELELLLSSCNDDFKRFYSVLKSAVKAGADLSAVTQCS